MFKSFTAVAVGCALLFFSMVAISGCSMQPSPCCVAYPVKPFKAVYECKVNDTGTFRQIWQSDGQGKMRLTISGNPQQSDKVTVIDYKTDSAVSLVADRRVAIQQQLVMPWVSNATSDQTDASSLGSKTIDGHPCVGWKVNQDGSEAEYWMGEDTGCYVEISADLPEKNGHATIKLVEYSGSAQNPMDFSVPDDYKLEKGSTKLSFTKFSVN